jgi:D-alanyl-D-alanine carboxypeptidase
VGVIGGHHGAVIRRLLAIVVLGAATVGCAPTRAAAPPTPELATAQRPDTTVAAVPPDAAPPVALAAPPVLDPGTATDTADTADTARTTGTTGTTGTTTTSAPPLTGWAAFDQSLRLELLGNGSPTASVAVAIDGELIRAEAFGDREPGTYDKADADDRFRVASISKVITAIVVLQLVEDGLIGIDEPVGARIAAHLGVTPSDPRVVEITPEQLLSHTSGFPQHESTFFRSGAAPCTDAARVGLTGSVAQPGGNYRYSNMNYCVAGLLIEMLTGQSYEQAVYQRLLTPLGISGMRLAGTYDTGPDEVVHFSAPGRNYMEALGAAGAWIATGSDIVRIVDSINPRSPGWQPLGDDLLRRMQRPPFDRPIEGVGYGLGVFVFEDGSIGHTGTLESTHAMVLSRPDGVTWALLVNGEYPSSSRSIASIMDRAFAAGFPDG